MARRHGGIGGHWGKNDGNRVNVRTKGWRSEDLRASFGACRKLKALDTSAVNLCCYISIHFNTFALPINFPHSTPQFSFNSRKMASTQALGAAALDRKARLAQLKSLKRKHPDSTQEDAQNDGNSTSLTQATQDDSTEGTDDITSKYLSGRNYDPSTRGAKLGFELAPSDGKTTLELQAEHLAAETKLQAEEEAKVDAPLDLFKLQPKKPNWDLKRDLERKLDVLNVRTDNAIARLVRERIQRQQEVARAKINQNGGQGGQQGGDSEDVVGIEGTTLVEAVNVREREEEEDARREKEEEAALLDGT